MLLFWKLTKPVIVHKESWLHRYLKFNLARAYMRISHEEYARRIFSRSFASLASCFTLSFALSYILKIFPLYRAMVVSGAIGVIAFLIAFIVYLTYPKYVAGKVKRVLEKNLVYITNYMNILASAGATTEGIFTSFAMVRDVFGVKNSAMRIMRDIQILGKDVYTAMSEESRVTPSKEYGNLLEGLVMTVSTGGKSEDYLRIMSERYMELRRRMLTRIINQLNLLAEIYVAVLIALPIVVMTMMLMMGALGGPVIAGLGAAEIMQLMAYIFIPFAAIVVILIIDMTMAGW